MTIKLSSPATACMALLLTFMFSGTSAAIYAKVSTLPSHEQFANTPSRVSLVAVGGFIDFNRNMTANVDVISVSDNTHNTSASPLPRPLAGFGTAKVNDTAYFVGGFYQNDTVAYNINARDNGNWSELSDFPYGVDGNTAVAVNNKIFSFGGEALAYGYMDYPWAYDLFTKQWQKLSVALPEIGYNFAVVVNESIYFVTETGRLYRSDDGTASWVNLTSMGVSRGGESCVALSSNDAILCAGGFVSYGQNPPVELYNITTNSWKVVKQMLKPRAKAAAVVLPVEDKVMVCGGFVDLPVRNIFADCEVYDWQQDLWSVAGIELNMPRHSFGLFVQ